MLGTATWALCHHLAFHKLHFPWIIQLLSPPAAVLWGLCLPSPDGHSREDYCLAWLRFSRCTLAFHYSCLDQLPFWQSLVQYCGSGLSIGQTWCAYSNEKCPPQSLAFGPSMPSWGSSFGSFRRYRLAAARSWPLRLKALYHFLFGFHACSQGHELSASWSCHHASLLAVIPSCHDL